FVNRYLVSDVDRAAFEQWARQLFTPVAQQVGWETAPGESPDRKQLRADVLNALGYFGRDPETLAMARKGAERELQNPGSVDGTLAPVALRLAALNGDTAFYDQLVAHLKRTQSPEAYYQTLGTLTDFRDPALLKRSLDMAMTPEIRSQDKMRLFAGVI